MDTIVRFGHRSLDLHGLQELQDEGESIILLFGAEHDPAVVTLTGADAQLLRDWIDHYVESQPNGLDFMVAKPRKQPDSALMQQLRSIAAHNLALLRRIALTLLPHASTTRCGIKATRLKAGWDHRYVLQVLAS